MRSVFIEGGSFILFKQGEGGCINNKNYNTITIKKGSSVLVKLIKEDNAFIQYDNEIYYVLIKYLIPNDPKELQPENFINYLEREIIHYKGYNIKEVYNDSENFFVIFNKENYLFKSKLLSECKAFIDMRSN